MAVRSCSHVSSQSHVSSYLTSRTRPCTDAAVPCSCSPSRRTSRVATRISIGQQMQREHTHTHTHTRHRRGQGTSRAHDQARPSLHACHVIIMDHSTDSAPRVSSPNLAASIITPACTSPLPRSTATSHLRWHALHSLRSSAARAHHAFVGPSRRDCASNSPSSRSLSSATLGSGTTFSVFWCASRLKMT